MAGNLLREGHELTVFNRTSERCDPLRDRGATVAATAAVAAHEADVLVTTVAGPLAVEELLFGAAASAEAFTVAAEFEGGGQDMARMAHALRRISAGSSIAAKN
jgi:3-hydroxyisobutyrate dehydrogenase-like beta-hydroxyacid dehydrogenase